ncbi:MAG: SPOR domain-containing protein [Hyphomicrobium sp.]
MAKLTPEPPIATSTLDKPAADRSPFSGPAMRARRRVPVFTPYVVIWTMFGVLSLGYMSIAGLAPDWLDDLTPSSQTVEAPNARDGLELAAEIGALRDGVAQIQIDVARIRSDVDASANRQTALETQVASLDQRVSGQTTTTTQSPAAPDAGAAPQIPKLINAETPAPAALETGSVGKISAAAANATKSAAQPPEPAMPPVIQQAAAPEVKFGPAIVKPAPKPTGLQIASANSVEGLRVNWSVLSENYGAELKNLEPRYAATGDPANPNYELVVGPMKSKAEAIKVCKALSAKSVPCKVGDFIGNAL